MITVNTKQIFKIWSLFGLAALLVFSSSGCGKKERPSVIAARDGILLFNNGTEPKGLDPHIVTGVPENHIISALIEGLIAYHLDDDSKPEPGVAERWEPTENYKVWTFFLRDDALWSNGDPVRAQDFVYSFKRMLSPNLGGEYADMLHIIEGGGAYNRGEITDFDQVGVKAIDDKTLRVTLVGPTPYYLSMLKHYSWFPVHPATIEKFGNIDDRVSLWSRPENFVGNGPFVLAEWKTNQIIRVTKSPTYWDKDRMKLNEIRFFPIENPSTEEIAFLAGQAHNTNTIPQDKIAYHLKNNPHLIHLDPYHGVYFYRLNVTRPPMDDVRVRMALNLSIDRPLIVEQVTQGGQRPAYGYTPDGMSGYPTPQPLSYDVEKARKLLAEAGFPNGEGFPPMDILINTEENHRKIAEAIQEMWRINLNIPITISNQEWKVYLDAQTNLQYDISRSGWIADFTDPITFLDMYTTGNGNNDTGWSNPKYDRLINRAKQANSPQEHFTALETAENLLLTEVPIVPIYWYTRTYLLDPIVKNWNPKLLDNRPYKYIYFDLDE